MALTLALFGAVLALVLLAAALAVAEASLLRVSAVRLEVLGAEGDRRAVRASRLVDDLEGTLYTVLLAVLLVQIGAATLMGAATEQWLGNTGATIGSVVLALVLFVYAEAIPKTYAVRHATTSAMAVAGPVVALKTVLRPLVRVLVVFADWQAPGRGLATRQAVSEDELRRLAGEAAGAGEIDQTDLDLVERAFEFGDLTVGDVMVPRPDVVAVPYSLTPAEVRARAVETGHRRLVVDAGGLDHVLGVVWLLDVVAAIESGEEVTAQELAREPLWVPEALPVPQLLSRMQEEGQRFAVVVDEYGGTEGIVTLVDILEALVGEVPEPFAVPGRPAEPTAGGWIVDGGSTLPDLAESLGVELPSGPYRTVAGLVQATAGAIPAVGDAVTAAGYRLTVEEGTRRRIDRVRITSLG